MTSRPHLSAWLLAVSSGCLCPPAWADIYARTETDGAVTLTNLPPDDRYSVLLAEPQPAVAAAPPAPRRPPAPPHVRKARYDKVVEAVSRRYGVESALLHAVISVESRYNPRAVSKKGATGLMQLMPGTARRYGVTNAFDPEQNLRGGARYLRDLLDLFDRDVALAIAAFNAGEHAVIRHGRRIPPYRETQRYVPKVLGYYQHYQDSISP